MGRERRKWTKEEDSLLRVAINKVAQEGRPLLWRELAKSVPGRTNKDCRRRWCNILADGSTKGPWTESEDERLCRAVQDNGSKWSRVAAAVGSRNSDQCSSHWSLSLNPAIDFSDWTRAEDEKLLQAVRQHGTNWKTIASTFQSNRTTLALKNHYMALRAKEDRAASMISQDHWSRAGSWQPNPQCLGGSLRSTEPQSTAAESREHDGRGKDDDDDDDDEEEDDADDDDDDDDEQIHNEPIGTTDYLRSGWQGNQPANLSMAPQQRAIRPVEPQSSYNLPAVPGSQGSFNDALLNVGQWGQEIQSPLMFSGTLASDSFPTSLQQNGPQSNIIPTSDNFGQTANFTTGPQHYSNNHVDSCSGSQAHLSAQYSEPSLCREVLASGIKYSTREVLAGQPVEVDRAPFTSGPSPRRDGAKQQALGSRKRRCRDPMPISPDSSCGCPDGPNAASPIIQHSLGLSSEDHDGDLHRVSVDAQCTSDQLGDLMRTLVGLTQKLVVKVER